jgi:hypothetical protein
MGSAEGVVEQGASDNGELSNESVASPDHKKLQVRSPETPKQQPTTSRVLWRENMRNGVATALNF